MFFAPSLATPVAKLYYEEGFEKAVAVALKEIPDSANACIYDDAQNIFVTSIDQLDLGRMIEKAIRDKIPRPRPNGLQRDPHFRVLANGKTYYWSFHDAKLYAFPARSWTLTGERSYVLSVYAITAAVSRGVSKPLWNRRHSRELLLWFGRRHI